MAEKFTHLLFAKAKDCHYMENHQLDFAPLASAKQTICLATDIQRIRSGKPAYGKERFLQNTKCPIMPPNDSP